MKQEPTVEIVLSKAHQELISAIYADARQTWPSITWEVLEEQAKKVMSGQKPQGGPGVFLEGYFKKAGFIKEA